MTTEFFKELGTRLESVQQVKVWNTSRAALCDAFFYCKYDRRAVKFFGDARGCETNDTLMPSFACDNDEVLLRPGSVVVQRGSNHAWANRSGKPCRMLFVLIDGSYAPDIAAALSQH